MRSSFQSSFVEFRSAVSEEKSKLSQPIRGQGGHLVFPIGPKNTNLVEDVEILLPVKFCWIPFSGFRGEVENVSAKSEARAAILFFQSARKNTNLVEDVEILLPIKFRWNPFSSFRGEVENVSANQRPGRPSCFSNRPEKHKLGRGRWDLASCQVSLNSVQQFERRSRKCLSQSEARAAILFFRSALKNTNLVEDVEILLPVKFRWIPFSGFRGEVENVSANQRPGRPSCFLDRPEKHKLGRGRWDLASCQVSLNSIQQFQRRSRKCESLRRTDGRTTTDGRTDDGRCAMTIAHSSLRLRWAKNL